MMHDNMSHDDASHHASMDAAIKLCLDCHSTCEHTMQHCLEKGGMHAAASHIAVMRDCAQLCITCEDFMARGSLMHSAVCTVCADACEACMKSCQSMNDDAHMQACIDACQRCADSCHAMSKMN